MYWFLLLFLAVVDSSCPCKNPVFCNPITTGPRKEIFGFSLGNDNWRRYHWSLVTTVAWNEDPELMCHAHSNGARVVLSTSFNDSVLSDPTVRSGWINALVQTAVNEHLDGCNFDFEDAVPIGSPVFQQYTDLIAQTADAFHAKIPGSQVSMDAAWSPNGIDGRYYDWSGIADAVDVMFVMSYDLRSQIYDRCIASANSPAFQVLLGVQQFLNLGIAPSKIVAGLPWYGYDYPCLSHSIGVSINSSYEFCSIASVPFRGAPCSDAAGTEVCYSDLMPLLASPSVIGGRRWDNNTMSPYFNYAATDGLVHQVWFDDPQSLKFKIKALAGLGIGGVGVWNFDCLNYSNDTVSQSQTDAMWNTFKTFLDS